MVARPVTRRFSIYEEARGAHDDDILHKAHSENRILITTDKDFGEYVYRGNKPHRGVVLLRLQDERPKSKIAALKKLLDSYADQLVDGFVVVTESHARFGQS